VNLNCSFSRLTLNSIALRTYHCATSFRPLSVARKKHAEIAIKSAILTLTIVLDEPDIQASLVGTQLFLLSMITFAAVFLLKIAIKVHPACITGPDSQRNSLAAAGLEIDIPYVLEVVEEIANLMISASEKASEHHVSHHIARGLGKMLAGFREWEQKHALLNKNNNNNNNQPDRSQPQQQPQPTRPSWLHDTTSLFGPISLTNPQNIGERALLNHPHPPAMLGVAPLSSERGSNNNNNNNFPSSSSSAAEISENPQIGGLSEGSLDPMMTDMWGFEEEYFPTGIFDFLQSQMPA
jgi:hypothetical protein